MLHKNYTNFVKSKSPPVVMNPKYTASLNGDEIKKMYLEEVRDAKEPFLILEDHTNTPVKTNSQPHIFKTEVTISNKNLFIAVQNNNVQIVKEALDNSPEKVKLLDDYGWSLLMIACQANAVETSKELLKRGADTSIRDKAGNSAHSLVIKNRNSTLADLLLSHNKTEEIKMNKCNKVKLQHEYLCEVCNNIFPDKNAHLFSTIHNINASKGRKIPTNYLIPESNRGYQIMLKVGWNKESGLGPDGSGKRYPIKTVQKKDRKGLGHEKKVKEAEKEIVKRHSRHEILNDYHRSRKMEVNFRREFY